MFFFFLVIMVGENFSLFRLPLFESPQNLCKLFAATVAFALLTVPLPLQTPSLSLLHVPLFPCSLYQLLPSPLFTFLLFFMFFFTASKAFSCHFHFHFHYRANCSSCLTHTPTLFPLLLYQLLPLSSPLSFPFLFPGLLLPLLPLFPRNFLVVFLFAFP